MPLHNILLINPRNTVEAGCIRRVVTPLGLLFLATALERRGLRVTVLDCPCEGYDTALEKGEYVTYGLDDEAIRRRVRDAAPDLVGITCPFSYLQQDVYDLCRLVKEAAPRAVTVAGGIHPTLAGETMLRECPCLDVVLMHEGEERLVSLIAALEGGTPLSAVDGIYFREDGAVVNRPARGVIRDLDGVGLPARHLVDMERYFAINAPANPFTRKERVERVFTSRGCPCDCNFCAGTSYWGTIRMRSAEHVIAELRHLKESYGIEEVQISDDNFTVQKARALRIFEGLRELGLCWCAPSGVMIRTLDEEMVRAMAASGCYQVTISPESGSQRVVTEVIGKPLDLAQVRPLVELLHAHGISVHTNYILGLPGETREELMRTFSFARETGADSAAFFIAVPYLGTRLYEQCRQRGWLRGDFTTADFKHANILIGADEPEYVMPGEELQQLVDAQTRAYNEWSKARNPGAWEEKYRLFLKRHADAQQKIQGRVV